MRKLTLNYYLDPGHGWVKCSIGLLYGLGIADKITRYSYRRDDYVYLEEDCDLGLLFKTCDAIGLKIDLTEKHTNNRSPIRSYDTYLPHKCVGIVYAGVKS